MGQKSTKLGLRENREEIHERLSKINSAIYYEPPNSNYTVKTIAKHKSSGKAELSFEANEILQVLSNFDDFWLVVVKLKNKKQGLVPSNCVIKYDGHPSCMEAWRNIQRAEAKMLLMNPRLKRGTYIIRPSSRKSCYALSVRDIDRSKSIYVVKHFLIKTIPNKYGEAYSTNVRVYPDIATLIKYFEKYGIGTNKTKLRGTVPEEMDEIYKEYLNKMYSQKLEHKNKKHNPVMINCISISKLRMKSQIRDILDILIHCTTKPNYE